MSAKWRHCVSCPTTVCSTRFNSTEWPTLPLLYLYRWFHNLSNILFISETLSCLKLPKIKSIPFRLVVLKFVFEYVDELSRKRKESLIGAAILQEKTLVISLFVVKWRYSRKKKFVFFFFLEERQISRSEFLRWKFIKNTRNSTPLKRGIYVDR